MPDNQLKEFENKQQSLGAHIKFYEDNLSALHNEINCYFSNIQNYPLLSQPLDTVRDTAGRDEEKSIFEDASLFFKDPSYQKNLNLLHSLSYIKQLRPDIAAQWVITRNLYETYCQIIQLRNDIYTHPFFDLREHKKVLKNAEGLGKQTTLDENNYQTVSSEAIKLGQEIKTLVFVKSLTPQNMFKEDMALKINQLFALYSSAITQIHQANRKYPNKGGFFSLSWFSSPNWQKLLNLFFHTLFLNILYSNPTTYPTINANELIKNSCVEKSLHELTEAAVRSIPQSAEDILDEAQSHIDSVERKIMRFCGQNECSLPSENKFLPSKNNLFQEVSNAQENILTNNIYSVYSAYSAMKNTGKQPENTSHQYENNW